MSFKSIKQLSPHAAQHKISPPVSDEGSRCLQPNRADDSQLSAALSAVGMGTFGQKAAVVIAVSGKDTLAAFFRHDFASS